MNRTLFVTGATGFLGSYVLDILLREHPDTRVMILTRAQNRREGVVKLWKSMQLHMDGPTFAGHLSRIEIVPGDLTAPGLGIDSNLRARIVREAESVLHIAASLNRKSEKACLNHNLRGTLSMLELAQEIRADHPLRRFSYVSTVAVAGKRQSEVVHEDESIDWDRSDYDPYARTKKFGEHMVRTLMKGTEITIFRPSIVMGDSRFAATSQFDMVRAFTTLVDLPVVPFAGNLRQDIVNADWVGRAIAEIHMKDSPAHDCYHLSAGRAAKTAQDIAKAMVADSGRRPPVFAPTLENPFAGIMNSLASSRRKNIVTLVGSLFKVFLPYITYDTVFDSKRAIDEIGRAPAPFTEYCADLYSWSKAHEFRYPHAPLPLVVDRALQDEGHAADEVRA